MQQKNKIDDLNSLYGVINEYYNPSGERRAYICGDKSNDDGFFIQFLVDRRHLVKYEIGKEQFGLTGGIGLAIGPVFFPPHVFWSHENGERFSMNITPEAIKVNLKLLDEFFSLNKHT